MMDTIRRWWYESNAKKSRGGFIFMCVTGSILLAVIAYIAIDYTSGTADTVPALPNSTQVNTQLTNNTGQ